MSSCIMADVIDVGDAFARAIAAKDREALLRLLDDGIDFCGLTPRRDWTAASPEDLVDRVILGSWFEPEDHIVALERIDRDVMADRQRVAYRLRIESGGDVYLCEQQAYYQEDADRITWLRVLCSGFRPAANAASPDSLAHI